MTSPVRLRLSRRAGFNLQEHSRALNGLPAIVVARPTRWGNPFKVDGSWQESFRALALIGNGSKAACRAAAVELYRRWLTVDVAAATITEDKRDPWQREVMTVRIDRMPPTCEELAELRGANLACWCSLPKEGEPDVCHAAVLLLVANEVP